MKELPVQGGVQDSLAGLRKNTSFSSIYFNKTKVSVDFSASGTSATYPKILPASLTLCVDCKTNSGDFTGVMFAGILLMIIAPDSCLHFCSSGHGKESAGGEILQQHINIEKKSA